MSVGKAAAQVGHAIAMASIMLFTDGQKRLWKESPHRTMIVLEARDEHHMGNIALYLKERKFESYSVIDEGVNEIDPHTTTALATAILDKNDENVIKTFSSFSLYKDLVRVTTEFDR